MNKQEEIRRQIVIHKDLAKRSGNSGAVLFIAKGFDGILNGLPKDEFQSVPDRPTQTPGLVGWWFDIPVIQAGGPLQGPGWTLDFPSL